MNIRQAVVIAALAALAGGPARGAAPTAYACRFDTGAAHVFEDGRFGQQQAGTMAFEIGKIDTEAQTAELVTPLGPVLLKTVQAVNAIHFLEVVGEGYLTVTTIYERADESGPLPAVHSRHFGVLGQPIVSQFLGSCRLKR